MGQVVPTVILGCPSARPRALPPGGTLHIAGRSCLLPSEAACLKVMCEVNKGINCESVPVFNIPNIILERLSSCRCVVQAGGADSLHERGLGVCFPLVGLPWPVC